MEEEGEGGGRWGKWRKRITRVFTGKERYKEGKRGSVEELPRIVVSFDSNHQMKQTPNARIELKKVFSSFCFCPIFLSIAQLQ